MYSTCIFCHASLGANEAIETFPVGRRLAFDVAKGRLWVICRRCERWNLSPLEERWEAIEECERCFRDTRLRVSTDNIGLARLKDGLELVRIGQPLCPEMAAWRYGDQFGRRRRRQMIIGGAGVGFVGLIVAAAPVIGLAMAPVIPVLAALSGELTGVYSNRYRVVVTGVDGKALVVSTARVREARLLQGDTGVRLRLDVVSGTPSRWRDANWITETREFVGDDALRTAAAILPLLNMAGGRPRQVQDAVQLIEARPDPLALFTAAAEESSERFRNNKYALGNWGTIRTMPMAQRLALEMIAHEDAERRALEGELAVLEAAWRNAEEVAAISDALVPAPGLDARLAALKDAGRTTPPSSGERNNQRS